MAGPASGGEVPQRPEGEPWPGVLERLDETECLQLIGAGRLGRLGYTGRFGPTVLPVLYKLHEGSIVFHTLADTSTEDDLRTGIANAEYQVAFEVDHYDPETVEGWVVLVVGPAHHVDTEAERASIISAGNEPWPEAESEHLISEHLIRVQPTRISGLRRRRS
jgi:nitroimidazol reductase NimA-like FMN-containing flavoprotein (pyridoxamine 5'-phosphate oxidase superfamily)